MISSKGELEGRGLATRRLQQAFLKWNDSGRLASVDAVEDLAKITGLCVEAHHGAHRILAYVLNRMLFAISDYWECKDILNPEPFFEHGHQPILKAISLLQDDGASFDAIELVIQHLIDAQYQILV